MSGTTISTSVVGGLTLTNAAYNPVSVLAGVTVSNSAGPGLLGTGTIDWTISNAGSVQATGTEGGSYGITLDGGGTVSNLAHAVVSGVYLGVAMAAVGTVVNAGSIAATEPTEGNGIALAGGGAVSNGVGAGISGGQNGIVLNQSGSVGNAGTVRGLTGDGVLLPAGTVSNAATGLIAGYQIGVAVSGAGVLINQGSISGGQTTGLGYSYDTATRSFTVLDAGADVYVGGISNGPAGVISDYFFGAVIDGGGSVVNYGSISGTGTTIGFGAFLVNGGALTNAVSASIFGGDIGVAIGGTSAGTVLNAGSIAASYRTAVQVRGAGSYVSNASTGTITSEDIAVLLRGGGLMVNAGSIQGVRYGLDLSAAGTVTNAASGVIGGTIAVLEADGGNVVNQGTLVATGNGSTGVLLAVAGTVDNPGTIVSAGTAAFGVYDYVAGYVGNAGTISIDGVGVFVRNGAGTVTNSGSIASTETGAGGGIVLVAGGTVTNAAGAHLTANWIGVQIYGDGTVVNAGSIAVADGIVGAGVWLHGPGAVSNASTGTIYGGLDGVVAYYQATLTNAGSIGGGNYAVYARPGFADRVIVEPGAIFTGLVSGGNALGATVASVLELAAGSAAGTIAGFDSRYIGFAQVTLDAGASWSLGGTVAAAQTVAFGAGVTLTLDNPGSVGGTIAGFTYGDTIVLAGITGVTAATLDGSNLLTVSGSSDPALSLQFDPAQDFPHSDFDFATVGDDTDLTVACFAAGTRILTGAGELAVERLRVGDGVPTALGRLRRVTWIGHRRVDCGRHARPREVWPVRVRAGAFGAGMPHRDLLLSPDHAVFVDGDGAAPGALIPIRYLINDATIVREPVASVGYWHVELDRHDVVLAEGLGCESYLDTGNRDAFENGAVAAGDGEGAAPIRMDADFARQVWRVSGCAPLVVAGAALAIVRGRLLERAQRLGYATTTEAAPHLVVDGNAVAPTISGHGLRFCLPASAREGRLRSRAVVPAHRDAAGDDYRRLGIAVCRIALDGVPIGLGDARLGSGWHGAELYWRWTDGDAAVELAGARTLEIEIAMRERYWLHAGVTPPRDAVSSGVWRRAPP